MPFLLDVSCPGVGSPCSGNGQCDLTVGVCTCSEGFQGSDCFGKIIIKFIFTIMNCSDYSLVNIVYNWLGGWGCIVAEYRWLLNLHCNKTLILMRHNV